MYLEEGIAIIEITTTTNNTEVIAIIEIATTTSNIDIIVTIPNSCNNNYHDYYSHSDYMSSTSRYQRLSRSHSHSHSPSY